MDQDGRLKIAFVIDTLSVPAGGTEGQLLHLLAGLNQDRFAPTLFCLQSSKWLEKGFDLCPFESLDARLSRNPEALVNIWSFSRKLREQRFDIVQTYFRDANAVGVLAARLARVNVIVSARRGVPYWESKTELLFLKGINRMVTCFVANGQATRERAVRYEGIDPGRIEVIYNGIDSEGFRFRGQAESRAVRERLGLPEQGPVIGIVANLRPVKGHRDFIEAASRLKVAFPDTRFLIVGQGEEEHALRDLVSRLGLGEAVVFLGARKDVPDLLQAFDVGVLASHYESFSNSILEYLAAGLPVIATDVGGAREVVQEGRDGFLVPPRRPEVMAERITALLEHPGGPRSWRKARSDMGSFTIQTMIESHERLYSDLVYGRRS